MSNIDLKALRDAIAAAEHKPGQWESSPSEMGAICDKGAVFRLLTGPARIQSWAHFSHKRDSWLAIAAVNALPALLDRLDSAERRAEEAEKERDEARGAAVKHGRVLQRIGTAAGMNAGGDLHGELPLLVESLRRNANAFKAQGAPLPPVAAMAQEGGK